MGFGADQFRTLVHMATDISHRVIMGKTPSSRFILADNDDMLKSLSEFEIWPDSTADYGVSCP